MAKLTGTWAYKRGQEELQTRLRKLHEEKDLIVNLLDHMIDRMNMMVDQMAGIANINRFLRQFQDATLTMEQFFLKLFKIHILLTDEEYMDASEHTSQMSIAYPEPEDKAPSATSEPVVITAQKDDGRPPELSPDSPDSVELPHHISVTGSTSVCTRTTAAATHVDTAVPQVVSPVASAEYVRMSAARSPPGLPTTQAALSGASGATVTAPALNGSADFASSFGPVQMTDLVPPLPSGDVSHGAKFQSQTSHAVPSLPTVMTLGEHKPMLTDAAGMLPNGDGTLIREKCGGEPPLSSSVTHTNLPRPPRTQPKYAAKPPTLMVNQDGAASAGSKAPVMPPEGVCLPSSANPVTFLVVPPPVVEVTGCPVDVVLSHYKSPNEFWLQLKSSNETLQMLLESLHALYSNKEPEPSFEIKVGMYCVAYYPVDTYWYRARVLQVQPGHVKVSYIDFGNCERVERRNVHPLDASLGSIPSQAICCAIRGIKPMGNQVMWDQQAVQTFKQKLQGDVSLRAAFYEQDPIKGRYSAELLVDSNGPNDRVTLNLAEHFVSLRLAEEVDCLDEISSAPVCNSTSTKSPVHKAVPQYPHSGQFSVPQPIAIPFSTVVPPPVHPEGNFLVTLSVVFSPSDFFGQLMDNNSKVQSIERLQERLNEYGPRAQPADETHIVPGSHWVCLYSTDQHWYRVRVLDIVQEAQQLKYKVFYIDYGNRGTVTAAELRPLTADLAKLPAFALHMALAIIAPVGDHWSQAANQLFVEKTGFDDSLFAEQKKQRKDVLGTVTDVVLWNQKNPRAGVNVNIFLVENNLAIIKPE